MFLLLFAAVTLCLQGQSLIFKSRAPKYEVRAVWLTTIGGIDWPHSYAQSVQSVERQKKELRDILDRLRKAHVNTVLLQTRVRGTMIYPSEYEPWDGCLSGFPGKGPGYDALQFAVDECHRRGMEIHAWVVTIPVGKWNALGCKKLRTRYPGLIRKIGPDGYMNPEDGRTGDYLAKVCREIAGRYDVDGIHLDYIRYPETWNIKVSRDKGRGYITRIVEKIHHAVKSEKPWVKMSCSPVGKFDDLTRYWSHGWNAYTKVCQDAQGWLRAGLMDELFPMMYFRNDQFFPFAIDWAEQSDGKIVAPGLGIYFLDPKEGNWKLGDVTKEMYHLRNIGLGYAFFRNKFFLDNTQGIYDFTTKEFNRSLALVPPMTWQSRKIPMPPSSFSLRQGNGYTVLSWANERRYEDGEGVAGSYIYNNVYASRCCPVDVTDPANLVAARVEAGRVVLSDADNGLPLYYAVTSMDRYGNESRPVQSHREAVRSLAPKYGKANRLVCDGECVTLPGEIKKLDVSYLVVENWEGQRVAVRRMNGNSVNVSLLRNGIYVLQVVNHRGVKHALGTFVLKKKAKS